MLLINKIKAWYRGKYVPPLPNDTNNQIVIISPDPYEQPIVANLLREIGRFWLAHWKWIVGIIIAIAGIVVTYLKND